MQPYEIKSLRTALGLSQAKFGERLHITRVHVGLLERGQKPITKQMAQMIKGMRPPPLERLATSKDPMEREIEQALIDAGIPFQSEMDPGGTSHRLDFHLLEQDVAIEVKRFFSPRSSSQLERMENVIFVQGEKAVRTMAAFIRHGGFQAT